MDSKDHCFRVLIFPWLAHGHISPFLELAKRLSQRNFQIYFCSTPINLNSIKELETNFPSIQLVDLHLPLTSNLPPHYHTTKSLPPHLMSTLRVAFDMAKPSFSNLLTTLKPDLLIYDFVQPWAHEAAACLNIPAIIFLSMNAISSSYCYHICKNSSTEFSFYMPKNEDHHKLVQMLNSYSNNISNKDRYTQSIDRSTSMVLVKTFREIEAKHIDSFSCLLGKEILPVGPLVQEPIEDKKESKFIDWLGKKDMQSVVFVSFGSEYFMSKEEIEEIGHGLELSMVDFIWVIRFPKGDNTTIDEVLPQGFLERVGQRGLVEEDWAPQGQILGHCSIGGFVSHCGWSSVMEGMKFGVPIIAMPMHLDQPINARLVVELGVGVEVKRENMDGDGKFERKKVAKAIKEVVVEKGGEEVRRMAKEMSKKVIKGEEEIDVVVEKLLQLCERRAIEETALI